MKSLAWILTMGVLLGAASAAAPDEHAGHHPPDAAMSQAAPNTESPEMMEQMRRMRTLMSQIEASKDEGERRMLLEQHRQAMHEAMQSMMSMKSDDGGCHAMMQDHMTTMMGMMDQLMRRMDAQRPATAPHP